MILIRFIFFSFFLPTTLVIYIKFELSEKHLINLVWPKYYPVLLRSTDTFFWTPTVCVCKCVLLRTGVRRVEIALPAFMEK